MNFQPLLYHDALGTELVSDLRIDSAFPLDPIAAAAAIAIPARQKIPFAFLLNFALDLVVGRYVTTNPRLIHLFSQIIHR